jgi:protein-tyrosine phosphatase
MKSPDSAERAAALDAAPSWAARLLPLQGARNFRDLGGYRTADGRSVRWGKLYRSGSMAELTPADCDYLGGLGIRFVCDLRTTDERAAAPCAWTERAGTIHWSRDYFTSFGDLRGLLRADLPPTVAAVRQVMQTAYRQLPFEQAPAYRELFKRLHQGELPMIFNCTAGKDRTGIAAALILSALGVDREQIIEDYGLTNQLLDPLRHAGKPNKQSLLSRLSPEVLQSIMGTHPDYLRSAFVAIEERHGELEHYLSEVLGIGPNELAGIRRELLD